MTDAHMLRDEVNAFAHAMEKRLSCKDPLVKSGEWVHWTKCERSYLLHRLAESALFASDADNLPICMQNKYLVDAANFAMMIFDRNNLGDETRPGS